jgi:hypothetical protein
MQEQQDWSSLRRALHSSRTFGHAGRPGRSVVASASALGAEDRRFESCRPDSVIESEGFAPQDHRGDAGVAQWQSPSLPSWPCEFDSRHPLRSESPSERADRSVNTSRRREIRASRAINGPLAVTSASDSLINRSRNLPIPVARGMLIDQCSAHTRVPHPMHQLPCARPRRGRQRVSCVAQIVEPGALRQTRLGHAFRPTHRSMEVVS